MTSTAKHAGIRQLLRQKAQKIGLCSHLQQDFLLLPAALPRPGGGGEVLHLSCLSLPIYLMGVRQSAHCSYIQRGPGSGQAG